MKCDVRLYFRKFNDIIGASSGKKTNYILVVHEASGDVHGYPVTEKYLLDLGVQL